MAIVKFLGMDRKRIDDKAKVITFLGTTPVPDRQGDIVVPQGARLENFRKNPVFLWSHSWEGSVLPIGRSLSERVIPDAGIEFDIAFDQGDAFAMQVYRKYREGYLNAVSIGFSGLVAEPLENGGKRYTDWELLELSGCAVPANPEALRRALEQRQTSVRQRRERLEAVIGQMVSEGLKERIIKAIEPEIAARLAEAAIMRRIDQGILARLEDAAAYRDIEPGFRRLLTGARWTRTRFIAGNVWVMGFSEAGEFDAMGALDQAVCDEFLKRMPAMCIKHQRDRVAGRWIALQAFDDRVIGVAELPEGDPVAEHAWEDAQIGRLAGCSVSGRVTIEKLGSRTVNRHWERLWEISLSRTGALPVGPLTIIRNFPDLQKWVALSGPGACGVAIH